MSNATKSIVLMTETNVTSVRVYDIPSNEVEKFSLLLPEGSKELSSGIGIFTVPDLTKAEESCDSLYLSRKKETVKS